MANRRTENTKEKLGAAAKRGGTDRGTGHLGEGRLRLVETWDEAISISFFICAHKIGKIFILIVFIGSIRYIFEC